MVRKRITDRQVLDAIKAYIGEVRHSPSLGDLGERLRTSPSNVLRYVQRLERQGRIERVRGSGGRALARGIRVIHHGEPTADGRTEGTE